MPENIYKLGSVVPGNSIAFSGPPLEDRRTEIFGYLEKKGSTDPPADARKLGLEEVLQLGVETVERSEGSK